MPEDFTVHPRLLPLLQRRAPDGRGGHDRLGHGRDAGLRLAAAWRATRSGWPARTSRRGTFGQRHAVLVDRVTGEEYTPLQVPRPRTRPGSTSTTRCSASTRRWASSTATRWPAPTRWCCGRRSSATSSTARRRSSTSTSRPASRSGASAPASRCCCRTATRARARTTPRPASSGSCRLCAQDNMTVAQPTTPANYFHLLRWQVPVPHAQAAGRLHPEVDAAAQGGGVEGGGVHHGHFRPVIGDDSVDPDAVTQGRCLLRQGLLRPARPAREVGP